MSIVTDVVDLSVPFFEGMPCDDLGPKFWERTSYSYSRQIFNGTQSRAGRIFFTTDHTGTHIDGPLRFDPAGMPIEQVPLERFIRPACVLDLRAGAKSRNIGPAELVAAGLDRVQPGDAAVLWTGHDLYLRDSDYFWNRPGLTAEGAEILAERHPGVVAADFPGLSAASDPAHAAKRALHAAGILTAEQLCGLSAVAGRDWHLFVAPLRIRGGAGSIVRACALVGWTATKLIDLTHDIYPGMPSLGPVPGIWARANHRVTGHHHGPGRSWQANAMMLSEHAGTHFDPPYHFDEHGPAIDAMPLVRQVYRTVYFDMTHKKPLDGIGPVDLQAALDRTGQMLGPGDAAVLHTGHDAAYGISKDFGSHRAFITAEGAVWLAGKRPAVIVTDLVGLDEPIDVTEPVHNILLHAGVSFLQVATQLGRLMPETPGDAWTICAFPIRIVGGTGSPLRAFAARA